MTVYVLFEVHDCPVLSGIYTSLELAQDQMPEIAWKKDENGEWLGSRFIHDWWDQRYVIESWKVDQTFVTLGV